MTEFNIEDLKDENLNLHVNDEDIERIISNLSHLDEEQVNTIVNEMRDIVEAENKRDALINSSLFWARILLLVTR